MAETIKYYNEQDPEVSLQWFVMDDHIYLTIEGDNGIQSIKLSADDVWSMINKLRKDLPLISNGSVYPKNDDLYVY